MAPSPRNGYLKWSQLWVVVAGVLALGGAVLSLHAMGQHEGAMQRREQAQFEKRIDDRLDRLERAQELQGTDLKEILRRLK